LCKAPSTPEPIRQQVIERLEAGERINPLEVRDLVKEARERERSERQVAKLPKRQQRDRRNATERRAQAERARVEEHERRRSAEREAAMEAAAMLEKALGDDLSAFVAKLRQASILDFRDYLLGK